MAKTGTAFDSVLAITRAGNLFTAHTAIAAGFVHFSPTLMEQFPGRHVQNELGISFANFMTPGSSPNNWFRVLVHIALPPENNLVLWQL